MLFISKIIENIILKLNILNQEFINQYETLNGTTHMHALLSYLTTIYSYFINYPDVTYKILKQKEFFQNLVQLTDLFNFFNFFSTHQLKVYLTFNLFFILYK